MNFVRLVVVALLLQVTAAYGQDGNPTSAAEPTTAQQEGAFLTLGRTQVYPSLALTDVGFDSNVYNEPAGRRDFTYTVSPRVLAISPIGDARLITNAGMAFWFFQRSKDQQALNGGVNTRLEVKTGRVRPLGEFDLTRRRRRSEDVDLRAMSLSASGRAGAEVGVSGITSLTGWVSTSKLTYDHNTTFLGVDLREQLSRTTNAVAAGARFDLTPLTSVVAVVERERTRFPEAPFRDFESVRVTPTVRFAEGAVIQGRVSAGYRDFKPSSSDVPGFRGLVSFGEIRFNVRGVTQFEGRTNHDLMPSFDDIQPYYLETSNRLRVAQRIVGPFDLIGIAERRRLNHRPRAGTDVLARRETITALGGGFGVRMDETMRLTITIDRERRVADTDDRRNYRRARVFAAVEYLP